MHTGYSPNRKVIVLILPINNRFRPAINRHIQEEWCGPLVVTRGVIHDTSRAEGFMATDGDALLGYVLYAIENGRCEILVLHSLQEHCGIGKALIDAVLETAKTHGCSCAWLITTNDNLHAIRYYQRVGFSLRAVHIDAIAESRKLKPSIPLRGNEDIPIQHEFEFAWIF